MKLTDQQKHDQLKAAGLLDSTFTQLTRYYGQLLRLDFGTSRRIQSGVSVVKVIGGKVCNVDAVRTDLLCNLSGNWCCYGCASGTF